MTEIQITTKTTSPVTLTNTGNTYLLVASTGQISGLGTEVTAAYAHAGLTITNAGTLIGGNGATGAIIQTGGTLHNTGAISGGAEGTGVAINGFGSNAGRIVGGAGVYAPLNGTNGGLGLNLTGGTFSNSGTIVGGAGGGSQISDFTNAYGGGGAAGAEVGIGTTLINTGSIAGGGGGAAVTASGNGGAGVYVNGGTLITSGTISGGGGVVAYSSGVNQTRKNPSANGDAVQFGATAGRLVVEHGAVFTGNVVGNSLVSDVLELAAGTLGTGTYMFSGIGTNFSGFNTIALDAGPTWSLTGDLLGETITGFTQADTLDLTNIIANGISVTNGAAVLFNGTTSLGTIHLPGSLSLAYLDLISDGAGGTELVYLTNGISGTVSTGITLTSAVTTVFSHGLVDNGTGPAASAPSLANPIIDNYGQILGGSFAGVTLSNGGTVTNAVSGTISGGQNAIVISLAAGSVSNAGAILATAGDSVYLQHGGTVTNSGSLAGPANGILVLGGLGAVSNTGVISSSGGDGMYFKAGATISNTGTGSVMGSTYGILATGVVAALNDAGTVIGQSKDGVRFSAGGSATITSTGHISGAADGLVILGSPGTVSNAGSIGGAAGDGLYFNAGASVSNSGTITGHTYGVLVNGAPGTLGNAGMVTGQSKAGVEFSDGGMVSNSSTGHISGAVNAVVVQAATGTVTNAGTISGSSGDGVYFGAGGSVSNTGSIGGAAYGVFIQTVVGTVTNADLITGTSKSGIDLAAGGTVVNTGTINGGNGVSVNFGGAGGNLLVDGAGAVFGGNITASGAGNTLELANTGNETLAGVGTEYAGFQTIAIEAGTNWTISGALIGETITGFSSSDTLDLTNLVADSETFVGGVLTLSETGSVIGTIALSGSFQSNDLMLGSDGNSGTVIELDVGGSYSSGIVLQEQATTITNTASISNAGVAVYGPGGTDWTVVNEGTLSSRDSAGIELASGGTVSNAASGNVTGDIYGVMINGGAGLVNNAGSIQGGAAGVDLTSGGSVSNTTQGTISSDLSGVNISGALSTVTNAGLILGSEEYGIFMFGDDSSITNLVTGTISGKFAGVLDYSANGTVVNAGFINGVYLGSNGTLVDSGTLGVSSGGRSAYFFGTGSRLVLEAGAKITGSVSAAGTDNVLELGSNVIAGTISGIGSSFTGFGTIVIDPDSNWAVSGALSGETIAGLGAGDTLDFTSLAANSMNFADGKLSLYENGSYVGGAQISGQFGAGDISLISDGNGGSEVLVLPETITGTYSTGITLADSVTTIAAGASVSSNANYALYGSNDNFWEVVNEGTISNAGEYGVFLAQGDITNAASGQIFGHFGGAGVYQGMINNAGTISGGDNGVLIGAGTVINSGTIIGGTGHAVELEGSSRLIIDPGAVFVGNVLANPYGTVDALELASGSSIGTITGIGTSFAGFGTINIDTDATWALAGNNALTGETSIATGATLENLGSLTSQFSLINNGLITTDRSSIVFDSAVSGTGTIEIGAGSDVTFNASVAAGQEIVFEDATGTLTLGDPGQFSATLYGMQAGDTINITDLAFTSSETLSLGANGILSIPGTTDTLTCSGISELESFTLSSDGAGGTDITDALCYLRGTRILTPTGEMPIEELRIGDLLVSRFGAIRPIKWIGRQSYDSRFIQKNPAKIPVRIKAGAFGAQTPARDLFVSPGHSMLLDGTLVLASALVNGITITQASDTAPAWIEYFQIEFDTHDCVIAEGTWSETYADAPGLRAQFHNAAEFYDLYPDQPPVGALCLCAPRPERGERLGAALRSVVARAATGLTAGPFEGYIDNVAEWRIEGWALDHDYPELPVLLEVLLGERVIGTVLACDYRADLVEAGIGNGNRAFFHASPVRIPIESWADLRVRRACDGALLQMTPACRERITQAQPTHIPLLLRAVG